MLTLLILAACLLFLLEELEGLLMKFSSLYKSETCALKLLEWRMRHPEQLVSDFEVPRNLTEECLRYYREWTNEEDTYVKFHRNFLLAR